MEREQPSLRLTFTGVSPTHHRLSFRRADGSGESVEVETRSTLEHDFIHLALESEAGLRAAFFGLLAAGRSYASLAHPQADPPGPEAALAEIVIGALTGYVRGEGEAGERLAGLKSYLETQGQSVPDWLTEDLLVRVRERFRRLRGQWRKTPFGEAMQVSFPLGRDPAMTDRGE